MGEKVQIKITKTKHLREAYELVGIARALSRIEECKHQGLPGLGLAKALVEAELATQQARVTHHALVAASLAGHDPASVKVIRNIVDQVDRLAVEVELYDLVDLADDTAPSE